MLTASGDSGQVDALLGGELPGCAGRVDAVSRLDGGDDVLHRTRPSVPVPLMEFTSTSCSAARRQTAGSGAPCRGLSGARGVVGVPDSLPSAGRVPVLLVRPSMASAWGTVGRPTGSLANGAMSSGVSGPARCGARGVSVRAAVGLSEGNGGNAFRCLVQCHAQREEVGPAVVRRTLPALRCHVGGRPDDHGGAGEPGVGVGYGDAEVRDQDVTVLAKHHVGRLDVPVHDPCGVGRTQRSQECLGYVEGSPQRQRAVRPQLVRERPAFHRAALRSATVLDGLQLLSPKIRGASQLAYCSNSAVGRPRGAAFARVEGFPAARVHFCPGCLAPRRSRSACRPAVRAALGGGLVVRRTADLRSGVC